MAHELLRPLMYTREVPIFACITCGHFACVCPVIRDHAEDCKYRRAVACAVAVECDHGLDVCPICDPCTCGAP